MDWRARLRERLRGSTPSPPERLRVGGLSVEDSRRYLPLLPEGRTPAAVLLPVIDRPQGLTVLLTERASDMRHHPGQIAFPGGRVEEGDADVVEAALRETEEEIGLSRAYVEVLGFLDDQLVISGFRVTPVVALVRTGFTLALDPSEVAASFEVPLEFILDPANHRPRKVVIGGMEMPFKDLTFDTRTIWGMTAGVLFTLAARLTEPAGE